MGRKDKSLEDKAYNYLHDLIIQHKLQAGKRIIESDIADCLGMSRTPVRAALRRLEDEKLVYSLQNLGTFVEQLTVKDVLEMNELRIILEVKALESCIMKASDEEIDECIKVTESISIADSAQDIKSKDEYFNKFIIRYCANSRILDILNSLNAELSHPRHLVAFTEKRLNLMKQDHLKILKYIKDRNYTRAAKALEKHHNNRYYGFLEEYMKMIIK